MNTLGQQLSALRQMRGLSIRELARRIKTDPGHVCRIESDQKIPSYDLIARISVEFDLRVGALEPYVLGALYGRWLNSDDFDAPETSGSSGEKL